jgi:putative redox protein
METKHVTLTWTGGLRFEGGEPGGPVSLIDADNVTAPGPMLQVLLAAASCSAADVVDILEKMREKLVSLDLEAWGDRREEHPRRYTALRLTFRVRGEGLAEAKVRRAIDLSLEKYCSVMHSLAPDIRVSYELDLG